MAKGLRAYFGHAQRLDVTVSLGSHGQESIPLCCRKDFAGTLRHVELHARGLGRWAEG